MAAEEKLCGTVFTRNLKFGREVTFKMDNLSKNGFEKMRNLKE